MTFIDNNTMSHDINFGGVGNRNTPCGLSTQTGGKFIILRNVRRQAHAAKKAAHIDCFLFIDF